MPLARELPTRDKISNISVHLRSEFAGDGGGCGRMMLVRGKSALVGLVSTACEGAASKETEGASVETSPSLIIAGRSLAALWVQRMIMKSPQRGQSVHDTPQRTGRRTATRIEQPTFCILGLVRSGEMSLRQP